MSVSITKLTEQDKDFRNAQNAQLQAFVEVSKDIKLSSSHIQQMAVKQFDYEKSLVTSLIDAKGTSSQAPIEALESNSDYIRSLEKINELPTNLNQPAQSVGYMNRCQDLVDLFIKETLRDE